MHKIYIHLFCFVFIINFNHISGGLVVFWADKMNDRIVGIDLHSYLRLGISKHELAWFRAFIKDVDMSNWVMYLKWNLLILMKLSYFVAQFTTFVTFVYNFTHKLTQGIRVSICPKNQRSVLVQRFASLSRIRIIEYNSTVSRVKFDGLKTVLFALG
jgi:hypothetical protein